MIDRDLIGSRPVVVRTREGGGHDRPPGDLPGQVRVRRLIQDDTFFQRSLVNSAIMGILGGVPQHLVALPLAYLFNNSLKRIKGFLSALYFAPFITSIAAISVVFGLLFSERNGLFNWALLQLHQIPLQGIRSHFL